MSDINFITLKNSDYQLIIEKSWKYGIIAKESNFLGFFSQQDLNDFLSLNNIKLLDFQMNIGKYIEKFKDYLIENELDIIDFEIFDWFYNNFLADDDYIIFYSKNSRIIPVKNNNQQVILIKFEKKYVTDGYSLKPIYNVNIEVTDFQPIINRI